MSDPTAQIAATARNKIQAQLNLANNLTDMLLGSLQKMIGLNLNAAKAGLETSLAGTQRLLSARDPQEFFSLSAHQAQPHAEIALTYSRHLASIASVAQAELSRVTEDQMSQASRNIVSLINELEKLAPAGSESTLSLMKSALDNVRANIAQLARSSKIAVETMEHHMKASNVPNPQTDETHTKQGGTRK